ncbi:MAG: SPFH domain-containing protein [Clostridiaceae bacterium]
MGLLSAATGAISGVLADQWREYFYCEAMGPDVLVSKGLKRINEKRSSNTKASDNIITNGSIVAVNDGQFMMIVEQGKVVDFTAESGEYVYDKSTEPSLFYGGFGKGILESLKIIGRRFTFGGDTAKDQRVYFFNTKEILGNKYGTSNPVPFRIVDKNVGLDIDIAIRCYGEYSYKFVDPILFYKNVCGNVESEYRRDEIDSQLKSELLTALQPAFARISEMGLRYSALPGHAKEIGNALNAELSADWKELRGIEIASFGVSSVTASPEDEERIKQLQQAAALKDPTMAAAVLANAQAQAMQDAAKNENGAFMAFAGMNAAQSAGGTNAATLFGMGQQQQAQAATSGWTCSKCGQTGNTGKFCSNCGAQRPEAGWTCAKCGQTGNTGKFCSNCGAVKPE